MKKLMYFLFSLFLSTGLFSQTNKPYQYLGGNYAVKLSYRNVASSNSAIKDEANNNSSYKFADDIGIFYQVIFPFKLGIRAGVKYCNKGYKVNEIDNLLFSGLPGGEYKIGFHGISIPVQFSYHRIDNGKKYHFYPFLEMSYDYSIRMIKKSKNMDLPKISIAQNNNWRKHNFSMALGMGWLYAINEKNHIGFRAYFSSDILPVLKESILDTRLDASIISLEWNWKLGS